MLLIGTLPAAPADDVLIAVTPRVNPPSAQTASTGVSTRRTRCLLDIIPPPVGALFTPPIAPFPGDVSPARSCGSTSATRPHPPVRAAPRPDCSAGCHQTVAISQ